MPPRNLIDAPPIPTDGFYEDTAPVEDEPKICVPMSIVWRNVVIFSLLHLAALYGIFLIPQAKFLTVCFAIVLYVGSALGITAGAHRLWSHRSYKARLPLRIFLACMQSLANQNDIIEWTRDHRVHHKYSETDADPHNALRGFFFAHIGWLLVRKHPDVKTKGKQIDLSDLYADPVCVFQRKFFYPSVLLVCFVLPTMIPWYFWGERLWIAFIICGLLRYCAALNATWLVNSAAHIYGNRPYDKTINPRENRFVAFGALGEGYHNFHHTFPHDYSTSEFGWRNCLNLTTGFLDLMAALGQVYDRRKMPHDLVLRRKLRTGETPN